jgi:hypothetical protein
MAATIAAAAQQGAVASAGKGADQASALAAATAAAATAAAAAAVVAAGGVAAATALASLDPLVAEVAAIDKSYHEASATTRTVKRPKSGKARPGAKGCIPAGSRCIRCCCRLR